MPDDSFVVFMQQIPSKHSSHTDTATQNSQYGVLHMHEDCCIAIADNMFFITQYLAVGYDPASSYHARSHDLSQPVRTVAIEWH